MHTSKFFPVVALCVCFGLFFIWKNVVFANVSDAKPEFWGSTEDTDAPDEPLADVMLPAAPVFETSNKPFYTSSDAISNAEGALAVQAVVSPSIRQQSVDFFWSDYEITNTPPISWTGAYSPCNSGTTSQEFKNATIKRVNYFRAMAGVPATISVSSTLSAKDQEAALMFSVNNQVSHYPPSTWQCYTANANQAAGSSNVVLGLNGWNAISAYVSDFGAANTTLGHRRWLFYPTTKEVGTGDVPAGSKSAANALWVTAYSGSRPPTREAFVAWPPPGYVPFRVVYPRWSFSYPGASFVTSTVSMISGTLPLTVTLHPVVTGYGDNTLAWVPYGYDVNGYGSWAMPSTSEDMTETVIISNVVVGGVPTVFSYTVYIFNDDLIAPTGGITINAGSDYVNSSSISLTLPAYDYRGVTQMRFYTGTTSAWENYVGVKNITTDSAQGVKLVSVQYRDASGNASAWYTDTIILDTATPTGAILINNGATYAMSVTQANPAGYDNNVVSAMNLLVNGAWLGWEPYSTTRVITFFTEGANTVYVYYKDGAGNYSGLYNDTVIVDMTAPANGSITLNSGASWTSNPVVTASLGATDNYSLANLNIQVDGVWQGWQSYATSKIITFTSDGVKTALVQYRDGAGNLSSIYSATITLDTMPPSGAILINNDAAYTSITTVTLNLTATDAVSVASMRLNVNGVIGGWQTYTSSAQVVLASGDGVKSVSAQYRDASGYQSAWYTDTITLDTVLPVGELVINGGAEYATQPTVTLSLTATDNGAVAQVRVSLNGVWGAWQSYTPTLAINVGPGDGTKTIGAQYRDGAGNDSVVYTSTIFVDSTPPTCGISINNGAGYTGILTVTLSLTSTDTVSVTQMRVRVNATWGAWGSYAPSVVMTLEDGQGNKTASAQYRDAAGNNSAVCSDQIVLDVTSPTGSVIINEGATYSAIPTVTLTLNASDDGAIAEVRVMVDGVWGAWQTYTSSAQVVLASGDGVKSVSAQYRDGAGNTSQVYTSSITLDTALPVGELVINSGAEYATQPTVTLSLTATDNGAVAQVRVSLNGVWGAWQSYTPTLAINVGPGDGTKTIGAQYRDGAGNQTSPYTATIIVDTLAPSGSVFINNGQAFTAIPTVTLAMTITNGGESPKVRQMVNGNFGEWRPFTPTVLVVLAPNDGAQSVGAQFEDGAGNTSPIYSGTVTLDTTPPGGSISLVGFEALTNSVALTLALDAVDNFQVSQMRLFYDNIWHPWQLYAGAYTATLANPDQVALLGVQFMDEAENTSLIIQTFYAPAGGGYTQTLLLNNGWPYAVTMPIFASIYWGEFPAAAEMQLVYDGVPQAWEPLGSAKAISFTNEGEHSVTIHFRDAENNESSWYTGTILFDTTPPSSTVLALPQVVTQTFEVTWAGEETDLSGVSCYEVEYRAGANGNWTIWQDCVAQTSGIFTGESGVSYYFRSRAADNAGNTGAYPINPDYQASVFVDGHEPDDGFAQSQFVSAGLTTTGGFYSGSDVDWLAFTPQPGAKYVFAASGITTSVDLVAPDGVTILASGLNELPPRSFGAGQYYIRLSQPQGMAGSYGFVVQMTQQPHMVFVPSAQKQVAAGW